MELVKSCCGGQKLFKIVCLGVVSLFIGMLYMGFIGSTPLSPNQEVRLTILTIVMAVAAIFFFTMALKVKRWWLKEESEREFGLFTGYVVRDCLSVDCIRQGTT